MTLYIVVGPSPSEMGLRGLQLGKSERGKMRSVGSDSVALERLNPPLK